MSILPTSTIFVNSDRIVISLPGEWEGFPPGMPFTTFLLDSEGRTTRTLGWTDDPTAFQLTPSTNTNLLPPTRTGTALETSVDPNVSTWATPSEGGFDPFPSTPLPTTDSATSSLSSSSSVSPSTTSTTTPSVTQASTSSSTVPPDTVAQDPSPSSGISTTVAISVGGGVAAILLMALILFFVRRRYRRKTKEAVTPPPGLQQEQLRAPERRADQQGAIGAQFQPVAESKTIEDVGGLGEDALARSTSLPALGQLQGLDGDLSRRRVPSREDLPSPVNAALDPRVPPHIIFAPQPRPPSRPWRGFLDDADYDAMRMTPGPLSVTEDYSTNAGEGSVDGYWLETASMREERLYRLQRPGHTPPPPRPSPPESSGPSVLRPRPVPLVLAPQDAMPRIQEMSDVGMSPIRPEANREPTGLEPQDSSSPGTGDATAQPTSSGMGSGRPLLKPQQGADEPGDDQTGGHSPSDPSGS